MSMMIHRAMARLNNNAPKEPVKKVTQVDTVAEETKPVEDDVRKGKPNRK